MRKIIINILGNFNKLIHVCLKLFIFDPFDIVLEF